MNSWKQVLEILKDEIKKEIEQEIISSLRATVTELIKENVSSTNDAISGYKHKNELLQEFKISSKYFHACLKQNYFHNYYQGKFKVYHVKQFIESMKNYKGDKPSFFED